MWEIAEIAAWNFKEAFQGRRSASPHPARDLRSKRHEISHSLGPLAKPYSCALSQNCTFAAIWCQRVLWSSLEGWNWSEKRDLTSASVSQWEFRWDRRPKPRLHARLHHGNIPTSTRCPIGPRKHPHFLCQIHRWHLVPDFFSSQLLSSHQELCPCKWLFTQ